MIILGAATAAPNFLSCKMSTSSDF